MTTQIGNVAVWVADLERAERFYVDTLGLEVRARIATADVREVIVGAPDGIGSALMLACPTTDRQWVAPGGIWKIFVQTDDLDVSLAAALVAGAELVEPRRDLPQFGVSIAMVTDPDGYVIELGQIGGR